MHVLLFLILAFSDDVHFLVEDWYFCLKHMDVFFEDSNVNLDDNREMSHDVHLNFDENDRR